MKEKTPPQETDEHQDAAQPGAPTRPPLQGLTKPGRWLPGLVGLLTICGALYGGWSLLAPTKASCARTKSNNVGAHRCKGCHTADHAKWQKSAHAGAFKLLPAKSRQDAACLRCHSTGQASHLQGVQCESCHGGGRHYISPEVMVDPLLARTVGLKVTKGAAGCTQCHTKQASKGKFDYAKMWSKIAHGKKR